VTARKLLVCIAIVAGVALYSLVTGCDDCDDDPPPAPDAHVCGVGTPWACDAGPDGAP